MMKSTFKGSFHRTAFAATVSALALFAVAGSGAMTSAFSDTRVEAPSADTPVVIRLAQTETKDSMEKETMEKEAMEKEAMEKEAMEKEAMEKEPMDEAKQMMEMAEKGDRDAALALAKKLAAGDEPDNAGAAKYAAIAIAGGGQKYAGEFVPNTKVWSKDFWIALQTELQSAGVYTGAIDGLPGRGTQYAVLKHAGVQAAPKATTNRVYKRPVRQKARRGSYSN